MYANVVEASVCPNSSLIQSRGTPFALRLLAYVLRILYYPYLYNGMQIINLKDTGFDVELEVAV